jgi:hypothetical protein
MRDIRSASAQRKGHASHNNAPNDIDYDTTPDISSSALPSRSIFDLDPASPPAGTNTMPSSEESIDPEFTQMVQCEDCGATVQYLQLGLHGPGVCPPPRNPSSARTRPRLTDPFAPSVLHTEHLPIVPIPPVTSLITPPDYHPEAPRHTMPGSSSHRPFPVGDDPMDLEEIRELGFATRTMSQFKCPRCLTWQNSDSLYVHKHGFCEKSYEDSSTSHLTKRRRLGDRDTGRVAYQSRAKQEGQHRLTFSDGEEFIIPKDEDDQGACNVSW